jgi:hypothetical protein
MDTISERILLIKTSILEKKLATANKAIFEAEMLLAELNSKGNQIDYCTNQSISSVIDGIKIKFDHIYKVWYQE